MINVEIYSAHSTRGLPVTYHLQICSQPAWRYYVSRLYHWYDMRIPIRLPGWKRAENLFRRLGAEIRLEGFDESKRLRDRVLSWSFEQDLRCYELTVKDRKFLWDVEITEEVYNLIKQK